MPCSEFALLSEGNGKTRKLSKQNRPGQTVCGTLKKRAANCLISRLDRVFGLEARREGQR